jgi:undecaprenyl-diphosphatase
MPEWIQDIDNDILQWFQEQHTPFLTRNLGDLTFLGSTTVLTVVALIGVGALLLYGRWTRAFLAAVLMVGCYFATDYVKDQVARHRPVVQGVKAPHSASFPSSHASLSMVVYLTLAFSLRRRSGPQPRAYPYAIAWALILTAIMGISRLYLGYHFLSDVCAGWLLGLAFAMVFYLALRLTERAI